MDLDKEVEKLRLDQTELYPGARPENNLTQVAT